MGRKMGKIWTIGVILCGMLCSEAGAQSSPLKFAQQSWDFGQIKEDGGRVSHAFEFVNASSAPAVIEQVTVSCGCTKPEYSRAPVKPSEKGTLVISYDPEGRPGAFRRDIVVQSGGATGKTVLTITGEVLPAEKSFGEMYPVRAGDLMLAWRNVNLGYVPRGGVKSTAIEYYNPTRQPLTLSPVYRGRKPYFDIALSKQRLAPGEKGVMTLSYDLRDNDVWGMLKDSFSLIVNDIPVDVLFSASGVACEDFSGMTPDEKERAPKAAFSSQYHSFGTMKAGGEPKREFTITNQGKEPLRIRDMKLGDDRSGRDGVVRRDALDQKCACRTVDGPYRADTERSVPSAARNTACGYDRALGQGGGDRRDDGAGKQEKTKPNR